MFRNAAAQKVMRDYYCESLMLSTLIDQLVRSVVTDSRNMSSKSALRTSRQAPGLVAMLHEVQD